MTTLKITDYELGFLTATSYYLYADISDAGWNGDEWMEVTCDGKTIYDMNFWQDDDGAETHCTLYATRKKGEAEIFRETDGLSYRRLW